MNNVSYTYNKMINALIEPYHDKEYDGIVLKMPTWFTKLNPSVLEAVENLKTVLDNEKILSSAHPDHVRNVYELGNYDKKKEYIQKGIDEDKRRVDESKKRKESLLNGEYINTVWEYERLAATDERYLIFSDKSVEVMTEKFNLTAEGKREFKKLIDTATKEEFKEWMRINRLIHIREDNKLTNYKNAKLTLDNYGCIVLQMPYLWAQFTYEKNSSTYISSVKVECVDGVYQIRHFRGDQNVPFVKFEEIGPKQYIMKLDQYDFNGTKFIKKQHGNL